MNSTDAWTELRRRYPWPAEVPDAPWTEHGWCKGDNVRYFGQFLSDRAECVIELGSWLGLSARHILRLAPNAKLICIDHWKGSIEHHDIRRHNTLHLLPNLYERFIKRMWEYRERVIPMRQATAKALPELAGLGFKPDLIYIDASHDSESVAIDVRISRRLFPEAQIMGDDWGNEQVRIGLAATGFALTHKEASWALI